MRAAPLNHEILDDSVEVQSVIEAVVYEPEEVSCSLWAIFGEEFDIYWSCACRHPNYGGHGGSGVSSSPIV